jgi:hypothetical protein
MIADQGAFAAVVFLLFLPDFWPAGKNLGDKLLLPYDNMVATSASKITNSTKAGMIFNGLSQFQWISVSSGMCEPTLSSFRESTLFS